MKHSPNNHNLDIAHRGVCMDYGGTNLMDAPSPFDKYIITPSVGDEWKDKLRKDAYSIEDVEDFISWIEGHFMNKAEEIKPAPHRVSYEDFKDIYQYAFGGCNEDFLKEKYIDWLGAYEPNEDKL